MGRGGLQRMTVCKVPETREAELDSEDASDW